MSKFVVEGGVPLQGTVSVGGSKNATLPILAATLLSQEPSTLHQVPDISDVHKFLEIMESMNCKTTFKNGTVTVDPSQMRAGQIDDHLVKHMRASILLAGPVLARFGHIELAFPGGCVLGKRSISAHVKALEALGATCEAQENSVTFRAERLQPADFIMSEASVTATENAIMAAVHTHGTTKIRWAAMEPHVQDLCHFLVKMGAHIEGIGTHSLTIQGGKPLKGAEYTITADYLEAGTLVLAAVLTNGEVKVENCPVDHLDSFWQKLEEVGANFKILDRAVQISKHGSLKAVEKLQTSVYPGFATDLQAPFAVLLTQCEGESEVHETLFDGRLSYLEELNRMGGKTRVLNPHQAIIDGATPLKGTPISSYDIRAGAAMVLAALVAKGETVISDINYIDRGYERLEEKLQSLGAKIRRVQE